MISSTQINNPAAGVSVAAKLFSPLDQACARLKSAGLRITQPRIAILQALIKRAQPASIEQLHTDLASDSCDLVTVYRCLAVFEELGLVRRSFLHNGTALYQVTLNGPARYHVVCKNTQHVEEIEANAAAELVQAVKQVEDLLRTRGYGDVTHVVEFFGVAPANINKAVAASGF